jgi:hypothetical protein
LVGVEGRLMMVWAEVIIFLYVDMPFLQVKFDTSMSFRVVGTAIVMVTTHSKTSVNRHVQLASVLPPLEFKVLP